ncbi:MAG: hypothetical protein MJ247_00275 [Alphaproteobacteria bacterium]|nr:hypothetical protein [Alphaproteobacteria bacterium]
MENALTHNAFGILGLEPKANLKTIQKRAKDLPKLAHINELPEYPLDYSLYFEKRANPDLIKQATNDLSNNRKRILHYFFRTYSTSENEEKRLKQFSSLIKTGDYSPIYISDVLQIDYDGNYNFSSEYWDEFLNQKNTLLLALIFLSVPQTGKVDLCLQVAKSATKKIKYLLNSEDFLINFKKILKSDDDIGIDLSVLDNFTDVLKDEFNKIFSECSNIQNIPEILQIYIEAFFDETTNLSEINQFKGIIDNFNNELKVLETFIQNKREYDENLLRQALRISLSNFEIIFNSFIAWNIYEHIEVKQIRNRFAKSLKNIAIELGIAQQFQLARGLIDVALNVCSSDSLKLNLTEAKETIISNNNYQLNGITSCEFTGKNIKFYLDHLKLNNEVIKYRDIVGLSFKPKTSQFLFLKKDKITIDIKTKFTDFTIKEDATKKKNKEKLFDNLDTFFVSTIQFIGAELMGRFVHKLKTGNSIVIDNLTFTEKGVFKNINTQSAKFYSWNDLRYIPERHGNIITLYDSNGFFIGNYNLSKLNVFILEEFIPYASGVFGQERSKEN